ncbi:MAG: glycerophosphodiester phosphodiesterase, partial [Thermoproteota archaeon]
MFLAVAHRGASAYEPENTLRAVRRALELGANAVEVDVRVTKDRRLAVIHDETLDRTTSGSGRVRDYTLAELKRLDAGMGERIPSLEEVLKEASGALLVVELKDPDAVSELASALSGRRGVIAVSF